ncbi:MAG: CPBP family intramembrane metalloprotease [Chloroflexi bacterium]|nr:CPBP family intramembrane metalloprotease [Chloroflexota bacterium]
MTEPSEDAERAGPEPAAEPPEPAPRPGADAPGLLRFSTEGRRAPGLFVVGWLLSIIGLGLVGVALLAAGGPVAAILWLAGLLGLAVGLALLAGSQTVERQAAGLPYGGPSPVLVFVLVVVAAQLVGYAVGVPLAAAGISPSRPVGDLLAVAVQAAVFLGVVRLVVVGPGALSWSELGLRGGPRAIAAGLAGGALFAGPVILVTSVVGLAAIAIAGATPPSPLPPTGTPTGLVLHLLAGGLIAPIYEEVLFRGVALSAWLRSVDARTAIVRSSLLFVVAHLLFLGGETAGEAVAMAFVAAVVRLPVSLALGWLYVRTGTLWASIGLHMTFNAVLIALGESAGGVPPA